MNRYIAQSNDLCVLIKIVEMFVVNNLFESFPSECFCLNSIRPSNNFGEIHEALLLDHMFHCLCDRVLTQC